MRTSHFTGLLLSCLAPLAAHGQMCPAEHAKLVASDTARGDEFGFDVALDGDTIVLGAPGDNNDIGAAYVFVRQTGLWFEQAKLTASNGALQDDLGRNVAIEGERIVVGAPNGDSLVADSGTAYVFERSGTVWTETAVLAASDGQTTDFFGTGLALDGDQVAIGAYLADTPGGQDAGAVYVFARSGSVWTEEVKLAAADGVLSAGLGTSVTLAGDLLIVGAPRDDDNGLHSGSVYVFERSGTTWSEVQKLTASDGTPKDSFGQSLALEGERLFVGAYRAESTQEYGAVYAFERSNGVWTEVQKIVASSIQSFSRYGLSIAFEGSTLLVGSPGHVAGFVYEHDGTSWVESTQLMPQSGSGLRFAEQVALAGSRTVIGAPGASFQGNNAGWGYVFELQPIAVAYCTAGLSASGCRAKLSASGQASATAPTGFTLTAVDVEGQKDGVLFFGTSGRKFVNWGTSSSKHCVISPVRRAGLLQGSGNAGQCDGTLAVDLNARWTAKPAQNPGAGAIVQAQLWYRDPFNTSNQTTSLSDALEFSVCP